CLPPGFLKMRLSNRTFFCTAGDSGGGLSLLDSVMDLEREKRWNLLVRSSFKPNCSPRTVSSTEGGFTTFDPSKTGVSFSHGCISSRWLPHLTPMPGIIRVWALLSL